MTTKVSHRLLVPRGQPTWFRERRTERTQHRRVQSILTASNPTDSGVVDRRAWAGGAQEARTAALADPGRALVRDLHHCRNLRSSRRLQQEYEGAEAIQAKRAPRARTVSARPCTVLFRISRGARTCQRSCSIAQRPHCVGPHSQWRKASSRVCALLEKVHRATTPGAFLVPACVRDMPACNARRAERSTTRRPSTRARRPRTCPSRPPRRPRAS